MTHFDVLVVGAGLSGIAAGYYLQAERPEARYAILEAREALGGTWDLFRYPGVRSDSDMFTLGYSFNPWQGDDAIAGGGEILDYIRQTARRFGIDQHIRFGQRVTRAEWSSDAARWQVTVNDDHTLTCDFLFMCSGYYDYDSGYLPDWPTLDQFGGRVVHPQAWPADVDTSGQQVVIIGSGATAVTLAPALAEGGAEVTVLQRSPTYVVARDSQDAAANWLRENLPPRMGYGLARWKWIMEGILSYGLARALPRLSKRAIIQGVQDELGAGYDVETHFTPTYDPWDQRVCVAADSDLFAAIRAGGVRMVTDHIACFTPEGIALESGREVAADVIVTATGLVIKILGGVPLVVDGQAVDLSRRLAYKGMMYSDVPNLVSAFGYTNASWTLKCELTCAYVCRLLGYMDDHDYAVCVPRSPTREGEGEPVLDFSSGYVQRALDRLPKQGARPPWRLYQNYLLDLLTLRYGKLDDGVMDFS